MIIIKNVNLNVYKTMEIYLCIFHFLSKYLSERNRKEITIYKNINFMMIEVFFLRKSYSQI